MSDTGLAEAIMGPADAADIAPSASMRFGTVTATSPALLVQVGAATVGRPCTNGAASGFLIGDYVLVMVQGADRVVVSNLTDPNGLPSGSVVSTVAAAAPRRFLFLDGTVVIGGQFSQPALWLVIPASWKSGSNIVLPDARGRTIVGAGTGAGLTARTLSSAFGEENHLLTGAESGTSAHTHPRITDTILAHPFSATGGGVDQATPAGTNNHLGATVPAATAADALSAHNNMQPSLALNWMVRT